MNIMRTWNEYVDDLLTQYPSYSKEQIESKVFAKVKNGVRIVLETLPNGAQLENSSALMGWDIILDSELNPWMMEMNLGTDMKGILTPYSSAGIQLVTTALELLFLQNMNEEMPEEFYGWKRI